MQTEVYLEGVCYETGANSYMFKCPDLLMSFSNASCVGEPSSLPLPTDCHEADGQTGFMQWSWAVVPALPSPVAFPTTFNSDMPQATHPLPTGWMVTDSYNSFDSCSSHSTVVMSTWSPTGVCLPQFDANGQVQHNLTSALLVIIHVLMRVFCFAIVVVN